MFSVHTGESKNIGVTSDTNMGADSDEPETSVRLASIFTTSFQRHPQSYSTVVKHTAVARPRNSRRRNAVSSSAPACLPPRTSGVRRGEYGGLSSRSCSSCPRPLYHGGQQVPHRRGANRCPLPREPLLWWVVVVSCDNVIVTNHISFSTRALPRVLRDVHVHHAH